MCICQLLDKEFCAFPEYLQSSVKQHPDKHFAFGPRQSLVALQDLEQPFLKADHVVAADRPLMLIAKNILKVDAFKRGVRIGGVCRRAGKFAVHFRQVIAFKERVGFGDCRNTCKPQLLDRPVLVDAVIPLDAPFGLRAQTEGLSSPLSPARPVYRRLARNGFSAR